MSETRLTILSESLTLSALDGDCVFLQILPRAHCKYLCCPAVAMVNKIAKNQSESRGGNEEWIREWNYRKLIISCSLQPTTLVSLDATYPKWS